MIILILGLLLPMHDYNAMKFSRANVIVVAIIARLVGMSVIWLVH